jgi:hypothetical protein
MIYDVDYATESLEEDLDSLSDDEFALHDALTGVIEENSLVRERLSEMSFRYIPHPRFDTGPIIEWVKIYHNMSRIKPWMSDGRLSMYRMIYALDHHDPRIVILGVMPRADEYSTTSAYGLRLKHDYEQLDVPLLRRH